MASKHVIVMIWCLILIAGMVGLAWTRWLSSSSDASIEGRNDPSIYEHLDPSFSREHNKRLLMSAASQTPEFGGLFLSKRGAVLNIYMAEDESNPEEWQKTRRALEELLDARSGLKLNVIKGDYTITQLSEWYDLMESEGIWDQNGVNAIDLHEGINKLYIGVSSEWDVEGVYTFLKGMDIPREAATVAVEEPPTPARR